MGMMAITADNKKPNDKHPVIIQPSCMLLAAMPSLAGVMLYTP